MARRDPAGRRGTARTRRGTSPASGPHPRMRRPSHHRHPGSTPTGAAGFKLLDHRPNRALLHDPAAELAPHADVASQQAHGRLPLAHVRRVQRRGLGKRGIAASQVLEPDAITLCSGRERARERPRAPRRLDHPCWLPALAVGARRAGDMPSGPEIFGELRRTLRACREDACRQRFEQNRASARRPPGIGSPHHEHVSGGLGGGEGGRSFSRAREAACRQRLEQ